MPALLPAFTPFVSAKRLDAPAATERVSKKAPPGGEIGRGFKSGHRRGFRTLVKWKAYSIT
jgi:hypothetical protein